jgi:hypothetical protein
VSSARDQVPGSIGVMSVATNLYLDYWKKMVLSADRVTKIEDKVKFYVFTDQPLEAELFSKDLANVNVEAFEIPSYGWPEATLLRYEIFSARFELLDAEILMHLDADMLFNANPWDRVKKQLDKDCVCLVAHPGFWRPKGAKLFGLYVLNPFLFYRDLRMMISRGAIGAWENDQRSLAYVAREFRRTYFCGGTWFGTRNSIGELLRNLANNVASDSKSGIVAIWHDESHINSWAVKNIHGSENPELCFDLTYPQIKKLTPVIIAVRKVEKTR